MATTPAATPPLLRRVNASKLLGVLSTAGVMTGTGLIEATGLTRATVHAVCNDLIAMGWVVELDPGHDAPGTPVGRPSRRFEFNSQAGYVLGIDVGAAKTTVLLADLRGDTVAKAGRSFAEVRTPTEQTEVVNQAVLERARRCWRPLSGSRRRSTGTATSWSTTSSGAGSTRG